MGKRFLFVIPPFHGHVNPAAAVARQLLGRGHEVAWVTSVSMRESLPEGATIYDSITDGYAWAFAGTQKVAEISRREQFFVYYRDLVLPGAAHSIDDVMRACAEFKPDALLVDQHALAGAVAAARLGLPWASSAPTQQLLNPLQHLVQPWIDEQVADLGKRFGVPSLTEMSDALILSFSSPLLPPHGSIPPQTRFVGLAIDASRSAAEGDLMPLLEPDRRKLLVSLSTIYADGVEGFLLKLATAAHRSRIQMIISTTSSRLGELPAPTIVRPWLPLISLMPHVDAVVNHGGSTTLEALYFGKPVILAPLAFDNFLLAEAIARNGAGIRLRARRASENDLERAIGEILDNDSYREAAATIGASLRAGGGAAAAADALLELVG